MRPLLIRITPLALACATACGPSHVSVPRLKPAAIDLSGVHSVVVGGIDAESSDGELMADALTHQLRATTPYLVHQRVNVSALLTRRGLWPQSTAQQARVARLHGADAVVVGRLLNNSYHEEYRAYDCRHGDRADHGRNCFSRRGTLQVDVQLRVVEAATGRILGVQGLQVIEKTAAEEITLHSDRAERHDPSTLFPKQDIQSLRLAAYEAIGKHFSQQLVAQYETVPVDFFTQPQVSESRVAVARAQQADWVNALSLFHRQAAHIDEHQGDARQRSRAHYNLGMALACAGRFDDGVLELQQAYSLQPEPLFRDELQRVRGWLRAAYQPEQERLSMQCNRGVRGCSGADTDWTPMQTALSAY